MGKKQSLGGTDALVVQCHSLRAFVVSYWNSV